jgi:hypothetical protein
VHCYLKCQLLVKIAWITEGILQLEAEPLVKVSNHTNQYIHWKCCLIRLHVITSIKASPSPLQCEIGVLRLCRESFRFLQGANQIPNKQNCKMAPTIHIRFIMGVCIASLPLGCTLKIMDRSCPACTTRCLSPWSSYSYLWQKNCQALNPSLLSAGTLKYRQYLCLACLQRNAAKSVSRKSIRRSL